MITTIFLTFITMACVDKKQCNAMFSAKVYHEHEYL